MIENRREALKYVESAIYLLADVRQMVVHAGEGDIAESNLTAAIKIDQLALELLDDLEDSKAVTQERVSDSDQTNRHGGVAGAPKGD